MIGTDIQKIEKMINNKNNVVHEYFALAFQTNEK